MAEEEYQTCKNVYVADALAWCFYKNGRYEDAKRLVQKALKVRTPEALFHFHAGMRAFPFPKLPVAQRHLLPVVIENVKRLGRLSQKRKIDEGRSGNENGATPFDADVEKDVSRAGEDEVRGQAKEPEECLLEQTSAAP